ncbi:GNAT family acetyltransferase [Cutibacterium sp.]|uniref:GNAT family acetyltransferase n=1 Tax=Cutibacterium sp. TaxID=1912221 RepID=UPI0026DC6B1E|nr:GNAT family acetyltransferase [Cutibacterium sp.]MDO4411474.1 GNAT family acetyltransferase [Cutibacterium sp.]
MTVLAAQLVSTGLANFLCCLALAVFGVVAWISIRRNIRGIDFDSAPCGPALKEHRQDDATKSSPDVAKH